MLMVLVFMGLIFGIAVWGIGYTTGIKTVNEVVKHADENALIVKDKLTFIEKKFLDRCFRLDSDLCINY